MNDLTEMKPTVKPLLSKSLGSQDLAKHRAMLGVELEVLAKKFDRFGWERDRGSAAHDRLLKDWMNALQDYPLDEVQAACAQAVLSNPNRMPNEGHVKAAIIARRAKAVAAQPPSVDVAKQMKATPEQRARSNEILAAAGFATRRATQEGN